MMIRFLLVLILIVIQYTTKGSVVRANMQQNVIVLKTDQPITQQLKKNGAVYEIRDVFDLKGAILTIPDNSVLLFIGGKIKNGTIKLNDTEIEGDEVFENIALSGKVVNQEVSTRLYKHGKDLSEVLNNLLKIGADVVIEKGTFIVNDVVIPVQFAGKQLRGCGYSHHDYDFEATTLLHSSKSVPMFRFGEGANYTSISRIKLDGKKIGTRGFDAELHGTWCLMSDVGVYNYTDVGIFANSLWKVSNAYVKGNTTGVVITSDSSIDKSEITGMSTGLKVVGGGNKITDMWINGCSKYCILVTPKTEQTNCNNNVFTNGYFGTDGKTTVESIIKIEGNGSRRVQDARFCNNYFILSGFTKGTPNAISVNNGEKILINECQVTTYCENPTSTKYIKNCVEINKSDYVQIVNSSFVGYSNTILTTDRDSYFVTISNNQMVLRNPLSRNDLPIINLCARNSIVTNNYLNSIENNVYGIRGEAPSSAINSNFMTVKHKTPVQGIAKIGVNGSL